MKILHLYAYAKCRCLHTNRHGISPSQVAGARIAMPLDSELWTSGIELLFVHGIYLKVFIETWNDEVNVLTIRLDGGVKWTGMDTATDVGSTESHCCSL